MVRTIKEDEECKTLLLRLLCGSFFEDSDICGKLISANILKINHEFANPFAKKLITALLNPNIHSMPIEDIQFDGNDVDFFKLVCQVIPRINPLSIAGANPMSKNYCGSGKAYPLGPKEAVYLLAFNTALLTTATIETLLYPEVAAEGKSCDSVLTLFSQIITVEHRYNLIMDKDATERMSINHHVKKHAEVYYKKLKANQTWVLNWTTIQEPNTGYYFPDSKVNTSGVLKVGDIEVDKSYPTKSSRFYQIVWLEWELKRHYYKV